MSPLYFFTLLLLLCFTDFSEAHDQGCIYKGTLLPSGSRVRIDETNPTTNQWHREFEMKYGYRPDGGAYKIAVCTVLVDITKNDVPDIAHRQWVWVQDTRFFTIGELDKSYN